MKREEKIKAIYEKIAHKTLSFGCWVIVDKFVNKKQICSMVYRDDKNDMDYFYTKEKGNVYIEDIIGHPVMIGDVLDYYDKNIKPIEFELDTIRKAVIFTDINYVQIGSYWEKLRKPIEEQSEECIDYVYNLISNESKN